MGCSEDPQGVPEDGGEIHAEDGTHGASAPRRTRDFEPLDLEQNKPCPGGQGHEKKKHNYYSKKGAGCQ